ncbi:unnamed protein product [Spirodela intermedia]|uniref:Uncharacterized protein n=1 Tax=Spirodela intermedia TaxID=51605 RepID=A0A7I8J786_SPIIN|nr:unnamed protein product [Spirodela intermedia]CAA6665282.1 unnamed protein product [Spirodela intermedia]
MGENVGSERSRAAVVVLVPFPAQGHVTPMVHLAAALCRHGFRAVVALPESGGAANFSAIDCAMEETMAPSFEALLRTHNVAFVVSDMLASWAIAAADRCSVPAAGFWTGMLATYDLICSAPELIRRRLISSSGIPLAVGGVGSSTSSISEDLPRLTTEDLPWLVGDLNSQMARFAFWQRAINRWAPLRWLIANTFSGDGGAAAARLRVFRVAPLEPAAAGGGASSFWEEDSSCLRLLDAHSPASVVYVSFGSWVPPIGGDLIAELAQGLETAGRPFLWVVKWAPQIAVLRHGAVGCFLSHCGWNCTMEAIRCRTPLLCYPVAGDQLINCRYIAEAWKIGVRLESMRRGALEEGLSEVIGPAGDGLRRRLAGMSEEIFGRTARRPPPRN